MSRHQLESLLLVATLALTMYFAMTVKVEHQPRPAAFFELRKP